MTTAMGRPNAAGMNPSGQLGDGTTDSRDFFDKFFKFNEFNMRPTIAVSAGSQHSLALTVDGSIWACGGNAKGQLGDGTNTGQLWPVQVVTQVGQAGDRPIYDVLSGVIAVSAGDGHSLALLADGTVRAWGANSKGELGDGTKTTRLAPVTVIGPGAVDVLHDIVAISAGTGYSLALKADGSVWAWGGNSKGQLGDGSTKASMTPVKAKVTRAIAIAAGTSHSLALIGNGGVVAWGRNDKGQLGNNSQTDSPTPVQVKGDGGVSSLAGVAAIAAAKGGFSLALLGDGTVRAWGDNGKRQLGDGTTKMRKTPVQVFGVDGGDKLTGVVAIAAGAVHSLALQDSHAVAWGWNNGGRLGVGDNVDHKWPKPVAGGMATGILAVAAGLGHSLLVQAASDIATWGSNGNGQLGVDGIPSSPVAITPFTPGSAEFFNLTTPAAGFQHSLAIKPGGPDWLQTDPAKISRVVAWGGNASGQLGDGSTDDQAFPVHVKGPMSDSLLVAVKALAAGRSHSLALTVDGHVFAWGANAKGQLGDGTKTNRPTPVPVKGQGGDGLLSKIVAIAAGGTHSLALSANGKLWAWGDNPAGQLGDGTTSGRTLPAIVPGVAFMKGIAAGRWHSLALRADGKVWAWGKGDRGQLGSSLLLDSLVPIEVKGVASGDLKKMVAAGEEHSLALRADGTVWAWGANDRGQVGDNSTDDRPLPVKVVSKEWQSSQLEDLQHIVAIAAGGRHSLALDASGIVPPDGGVVRSWGANGSGQLGDNGSADSLWAVNAQIDPGGALRSVCAIAGGQAHSLAIAVSDSNK